MNEWQPIETAPKDRRAVLLHMPETLDEPAWQTVGFKNPAFVADWPADLFHLFHLFHLTKVMLGRKYEQTKHVECSMVILPNLPSYAPEVPHNPLSDARAIRDALDPTR